MDWQFQLAKSFGKTLCTRCKWLRSRQRNSDRNRPRNSFGGDEGVQRHAFWCVISHDHRSLLSVLKQVAGLNATQTDHGALWCPCLRCSDLQLLGHHKGGERCVLETHQMFLFSNTSRSFRSGASISASLVLARVTASREIS